MSAAASLMAAILPDRPQARRTIQNMHGPERAQRWYKRYQMVCMADDEPEALCLRNLTCVCCPVELLLLVPERKARAVAADIKKDLIGTWWDHLFCTM